MKRYIRTSYIPDMTERYPEGFRNSDYDRYDVLPDDITARDALEQFSRLSDPDQIRRVDVYYRSGDLCCSVDDIMTACEELAHLDLIDQYIYDAYDRNGLITITLM